MKESNVRLILRPIAVSLLIWLFLGVCLPSWGQPLRIQRINHEGSSVSIEYASDPDLYYVLDRLAALEAGTGTPVALELGTDGMGQRVDANPPSEAGFYQLRSYPQLNPGDSDQDGMDDMYELRRSTLNPFNPSDAFGLRFFGLVSTTEIEAYLNNYKVGRGRHDITGLASSGGMMGYADENQKSTGLHDRQWARAFIVEDREPPFRRVVFVAVDAGQLFQSVTQGVFDKIRNDPELQDHYSFENIILSATHTHGGAAGHAHKVMFNLTVGLFQWRTYDALVHGIYMAIKKAHRDLGLGSVTINVGQLTDASENRRPSAHAANVEHDYPQLLGSPFGNDNRDTEMLTLKFTHKNQGGIAMFNWFPVHGVSVSQYNTLLTGDNKGNAAYMFEKEMGALYPGYPGYDPDNSTFVAGFANSNEGDITANRRTKEPVLFSNGASQPADWTKPLGWPNTQWPLNGVVDFERASLIGGRQFEKALALYNGAEGNPAKLSGDIDYRHMYFDINTVAVVPTNLYPYNVPGVEFPGPKTPPWATYYGAYGIEIKKGTLDGKGIINQSEASADIQAWDNSPGAHTPEFLAFQEPKNPWLFTTLPNTEGEIDLISHVVPISILKIGDFLILAVPAEFTVMAGARLRKTVENVFAEHGKKVRTVIAGLANSYVGYVTTYEEYTYVDNIDGVEHQTYEGASTHFGAYTLAAFQTKFAELAESMATGADAPASPVSVQMPSAARTDPPPVLDLIPFLDSPPPPDIVAANFEQKAGCPTGQLHDLPTGNCFSCPTGYNRNLFVSINDPNVCEKPAYSTFEAALSTSSTSGPFCPAGYEYDIGLQGCYKCPSGYARTDLLIGWDQPNVCKKVLSTSADSVSGSGGSDCPSGYVWDIGLQRCYKCPSGYSRTDIFIGWNQPNVCKRVESTSALSEAGTGIFGSDCRSGWEWDIGLGKCYKCPSGYSRTDIFIGWNQPNVCKRTVSTSALSTSGSGGSDCPSGYEWDIGLQRCYKCPSGYSRTDIFIGWNQPNVCKRTVSTSSERVSGRGDCPSGYVYDLILQRCYKCPSGSNKLVFVPWNDSGACERVHPVTYAAATIGIKFHCDQRNARWFFDPINTRTVAGWPNAGECWSCPGGPEQRNLNPVNGGEACTVPQSFGDMIANPLAFYSKGETVFADFWAGHPGNVFGTSNNRKLDAIPTFLEVQRLTLISNFPILFRFETFRTDADWDTAFEWSQYKASGRVSVKWVIPADAQSGMYRIIHRGYSGSLGGVSAYSGVSEVFQVTD